MKILHAPVNIAGQPYQLVRALRRKGFEAELLVFKERPFVRGYDRSLHLERHRNRIVKWLVEFQSFLQAAVRYDVFHYHASMTLLYPFRWDVPILKALGKKIVFQFWGSDARGKQPEELAYLRYADAVIVGSYHMLDFVPKGSHVVLPGLNLSQWPFSEPGQTGKEPVRVVHAPSKRRVKGTVHVLEAAEALRKRGAPFELVLVEGVPNAEAVEIYRTCDIAIDQIAGGWYGIFALETMAMGKAVMGYIKPKHAERLEAAQGVCPPLASISPTTLADKLENLIRDRDRRAALGKLCRSYVEQTHDIDDSAEQLIQIYRQV